MTTITPEALVNELVRAAPRRSRVFEAYGIPYCCSAKRSVAEASAEAGVGASELIAALEAADRGTEATLPGGPCSLQEASADIAEAHHAYIRGELPRLAMMARRVAQVHGNRDERLARVDALTGELSRALLEHVEVTETALNHALEGEQSAASGSRPDETLRSAETLREEAAGLMASLNAYTDGYTPPDWGCNTYRAMLDGMSDLNANTEVYFHKVTMILLPRLAGDSGAPSGSPS
jgi:regulator of cell morphogenesis and NO signaling